MANEQPDETPEEPTNPVPSFPVEAVPQPPVDPLTTNLGDIDRAGGDGG